MKEDKPKLPEDYTPFDRLYLCGNYLENVQVPFVIKHKVPLLIGKGDIPLIWLRGPAKKDEKVWIDMVVKNEKIQERATVGTVDVSWDNELKKEKKMVYVLINDKVIIQVIKRSEEEAVVLNLDLTPIGFNIYGNPNKLIVGTNTFTHNNFKNLWSMIGIG